MRCPGCGSEVRNDALFCPECGTKIQQNPGYPNNDYHMPGRYNSGGGYPPNKRDNSKVILAVVIAAGSILFIVAAMFMFMMLSGTGPFKPAPTATPIPTASPTPTPTPVPTPEPTVQVIYVTQPPQAPPAPPQQVAPATAAVRNPSYNRYTNSDYGFGIAYPSHFTAYNDGGTLTLHTVQSSDGRARELIAAEPTRGATVSSSMNNFISRHPGTVTYRTSGNDYYAICIRDGATEYYKYCKFKNGNMYWFEFISPSAEHEIYDVYINDIYASMSVW